MELSLFDLRLIAHSIHDAGARSGTDVVHCGLGHAKAACPSVRQTPLLKVETRRLRTQPARQVRLCLWK